MPLSRNCSAGVTGRRLVAGGWWLEVGIWHTVEVLPSPEKRLTAGPELAVPSSFSATLPGKASAHSHCTDTLLQSLSSPHARNEDLDLGYCRGPPTSWGGVYGKHSQRHAIGIKPTDWLASLCSPSLLQEGSSPTVSSSTNWGKESHQPRTFHPTKLQQRFFKKWTNTYKRWCCMDLPPPKKKSQLRFHKHIGWSSSMLIHSGTMSS